MSVQRTVAQLDFYDFISFGELSTNRINGGNANLAAAAQRGNSGRPQSIRLFGDGLFKLDLGHDLISMLQDRILICEPDDNRGPDVLRRSGQSWHRQALFRLD